MTLEENLRQTTTCAGCGESKQQGLVVCWNCFKYRPNAYEYSDLTLNEWLESVHPRDLLERAEQYQSGFTEEEAL